MMRFLRKLWGDRRGNVLVLTAMVMPLLVGAAGLATDTIMWSMWKRELQRAADSAAFAGVYARIQEDGAATAEDEINADLLKHNTTGVTLLAGYPVIQYPNVHKNAVRVTLAIQKKLSFSSLFLSTPPIIVTSAVAAQVQAYKYCLMGLSPTGSSLSIGGSAIVDMGCAAYAASTDDKNAVNIMGVDHYFEATAIVSAGEIDGPINGTTTLVPHDPTLTPDPYVDEDGYPTLDTDVPVGMECKPLSDHIVSQSGSSSTGDLHVVLEPGCYSSFATGNGKYEMQPGTYYLEDTNLTLQGSTQLIGPPQTWDSASTDGVTIVLTGDNPGKVQNNGTSSFQLRAPSDPNHPFYNLVLVQSPNATEGNNNFINGDNGTLLDGGIYFPKGDLTISGNTGQATQCLMIIGWTVTFTGDADVQNSVSADCAAKYQVEAEKVRLIT